MAVRVSVPRSRRRPPAAARDFAEIRRALFAGALLTPTVATLTAAAPATVAVTTTLVLPAVRAATRPSGLRTE